MSIALLFKEYFEQNRLLGAPQSLYEPADYMMQLGGKRMRPQLLLMSCELFAGDVAAALPAAFAVEIFHNFTLVHDDMMDESPMRRGQPTVHIKYGQNTSILSGDAMLILAYRYLAKCNSEKLSQILAIFNKFAIEVCEGQQHDMDFERRTDVTIDDYLKMIELKTSVLLAGAMQIGAVLAGASEADTTHIYEFGLHIGIAFQIRDDILDTFGDPTTFGKRIGGDIVQNKKTILILKALEIADAPTQADLRHALGKPTTAEDEIAKINYVTNILKKLNIEHFATDLQRTYQKRAFEHLAAVSVSEKQKTALRQVTNELFGREI